MVKSSMFSLFLEYFKIPKHLNKNPENVTIKLYYQKYEK